MSTGSSAYLSVRGIEVDVVYKDIKHLHIGVYPPFGRVRVAAPTRIDEDTVRLALIRRLAWIRRERARLRSVERQSEREMVSGESHFVWGRRLRLHVVERPGAARVEVKGQRLVLYAPAGAGPDRRRAVLDRWYRQQLHDVIPPLLSEWEPRMEVQVPGWSVQRMKTKWGACNPDTRRLRFNTELAKKHPECLEYILVHEMCHYFERGHGERFADLMDNFLPDWRDRRDRLNGAPLAHEIWEN